MRLLTTRAVDRSLLPPPPPPSCSTSIPTRSLAFATTIATSFVSTIVQDDLLSSSPTHETHEPVRVRVRHSVQAL